MDGEKKFHFAAYILTSQKNRPKTECTINATDG